LNPVGSLCERNPTGTASDPRPEPPESPDPLEPLEPLDPLDPVGVPVARAVVDGVRIELDADAADAFSCDEPLLLGTTCGWVVEVEDAFWRSDPSGRDIHAPASTAKAKMARPAASKRSR
jgi:hypothetical protein